MVALEEALRHIDAVEDHLSAAYISQVIETIKVRLAGL